MLSIPSGKRPHSTPSIESMKTDNSKGYPLNFKEKDDSMMERCGLVYRRIIYGQKSNISQIQNILAIDTVDLIRKLLCFSKHCLCPTLSYMPTKSDYKFKHFILPTDIIFHVCVLMPYFPLIVITHLHNLHPALCP